MDEICSRNRLGLAERPVSGGDTSLATDGSCTAGSIRGNKILKLTLSDIADALIARRCRRAEGIPRDRQFLGT